MAKISRDEVLKLAAISRLEIHEDEIAGVIKQLDSVLSYVERLQEVTGKNVEPSRKNVNVFRADVVKRTNPETVLAASAQREENFFVVPSILENN